MLTLAAGTALASAMLGGCATQAAPRADLSAGRAELALKGGKVSDAVAHAEAAVLADPQTASYRAVLGAAYLEAGRFLSARQSFDDAMTLGDESPRTALGFALAAIATGDSRAAIEVLEDWRDEIPAADLGLAIALAGQPDQGALVLSNAIRNGDNTPKSRQNLAYALALGGNWSAARIMAAEDVPAGELDARIAQWASMARAEASPTRIAALLGTRVAADGGQPAQLALVNNPSIEQLATEAATPATLAEAAPAPAGELPALAVAEPMAAEPPVTAVAAVSLPSVAPQESFQTAFVEPIPAAVTPAQMIAAAVDYVSQPMVQQAPEPRAAAQPVPRRTVAAAPVASAPALASGDHLVQLGSFSSEASARRAWDIYAKQFKQLAGFEMVITKAMVRGKTYYRVSAGGLSRAGATSTCSSVKRQGQGCIAWAEGRPLPGAIDTGVRLARR